MHTHTTGVIEVAGDLKTARGCWLSPGEETFAENGEAAATWAWSKIGADFIQEDGVWKIWRMRVYPVFQAPYDTCWTDVPPYEGFVAETHCDRPSRGAVRLSPRLYLPGERAAAAGTI